MSYIETHDPDGFTIRPNTEGRWVVMFLWHRMGRTTKKTACAHIHPNRIDAVGCVYERFKEDDNDLER